MVLIRRGVVVARRGAPLQQGRLAVGPPAAAPAIERGGGRPMLGGPTGVGEVKQTTET